MSSSRRDAPPAAGRRCVGALVASEVVSAAGSQMTWLALPWFVLTTSGSPMRAASVLFAQILPMSVAGIPAGVVVARLGARRTLMTCDAARALLVALIPALHGIGLLTYPLLLLVVLALGVFYVPAYAAQRVAITEATRADERAVAGSNGLLQAATRFPVLLGSISGAVLISALGVVPVLYLNAVTFLISGALIAVFVPATHRPRSSASWRTGPAVLIRDRTLLLTVTSSMSVETVFQALVITLPVLVVTRYDADARLLGVLIGAWGAGALVGGLSAPGVLRHISTRRLAMYGGFGYCLPLWGLVFFAGPVVTAVSLAVSGLANELALASRTTLVTLSVPEASRPHVLSAYTTLSMVAGLPGLALAGVLLGSLRAGQVLAIVAAVGTAGALLMLPAGRGPAARGPLPDATALLDAGLVNADRTRGRTT